MNEPKWIAVENELPPIGQRVLAFGIDVYQDTREVHEARLCADNTWRTRATYSAAPDEYVELESVTHWMSLPNQP